MANRRAGTGMVVLLTAALAIGLAPAPVTAQESAEARLRRLEAEMRAVQRQVYPQSGGVRYGPAVPGPAASTVTDLLARVEAVERQLARLTSQLEATANQNARLAARLSAAEGRGSGAPAEQLALVPASPPPRPPAGAAITTNPPVIGGAGLTGSTRLAAVRSVVRPVSDDAGEDDYVYGFRLWEAGLLPEAAQQLKTTVERYPRHKRLSYTRNLLGRAYLDDGKPGTAAQVFLENYQADRKGARAPDSLLYLAVAMGRLKETDRACVALQELSEVFPAEVAGRLADDYAAARSLSSCD